MSLPHAGDQWNALGPWMYDKVMAVQLGVVSPVVGWGEGKMTLVHNGWPKGEGGGMCLADVSYPDGGVEYSAGIEFPSPVLNVKHIGASGSSGLFAVKLTDGICVADTREGTPLSNTISLESKRPKHIGVKSPGLSCQPNGTNVAYSVFSEGSVGVWDCSNESKKATSTSVLGKVEDVAFSQTSGDTVFCVTDNGYMVAVDLRGGKKEYIAPMSMPLKSVSTSQGSDHVVAAGGRDGVLIWDVRCTKIPLAHYDPSAPISRVALHPTDPSLTASTTTTGTIHIWDLSLPTPLVFSHHGHPPATVTSICWAPQHPNTLCSVDTAGGLHMYTPSILSGEES